MAMVGVDSGELTA